MNKAAKIISIAYVAWQNAVKWLCWTWSNRKAVATGAMRHSVAFLLGALVCLAMTRGSVDRAIAVNNHPTATPVAAAQEIDAPKPEETAAAYEAARLVALQEAELRRDAEAMARVLYGTARYHSREAQEAVCWCIVNRVESVFFPNSVEEVCAQPAQWMAYADTNPVTKDLYDVAMTVLNAWAEGGMRMFGQDFLFLTWTDTEITFRTNFKETANTRYYHVNG